MPKVEPVLTTLPKVRESPLSRSKLLAVRDTSQKPSWYLMQWQNFWLLIICAKFIVSRIRNTKRYRKNDIKSHLSGSVGVVEGGDGARGGVAVGDAAGGGEDVGVRAGELLHLDLVPGIAVLYPVLYCTVSCTVPGVARHRGDVEHDLGRGRGGLHRHVHCNY